MEHSERSPSQKAGPPWQTTPTHLDHPRQKEKETNTPPQMHWRTVLLLYNDLQHNQTSTKWGAIPHQSTNQQWKQWIEMGIDLQTFRYWSKSPSTTPKTLLPSQWVNILHWSTQVPCKQQLHQSVCQANIRWYSRHWKFNCQQLHKISPTTLAIQNLT